jgi:hypothetical protein
LKAGKPRLHQAVFFFIPFIPSIPAKYSWIEFFLARMEGMEGMKKFNSKSLDQEPPPLALWHFGSMR